MKTSILKFYALSMIILSSSIIACPTHIGHRINGTQPMMVKNDRVKKEPGYIKSGAYSATNRSTEKETCDSCASALGGRS